MVTLLAAAPSMFEKVHFIWPEISLFVATCVVMVVGLSPNLRRAEALCTDRGAGAGRRGRVRAR